MVYGDLWCFVTFDAALLHFFAIYAVLLRNLFCSDFLAFVWRNIDPLGKMTNMRFGLRRLGNRPTAIRGLGFRTANQPLI